MTAEQVKQIQNSAKFRELTSKRSKFAWTLSIVMLVVYYAFILIIAFDPSLLGAKTGSGVMTVGIPVGLVIIISAFVLTGIYVKRANSEFDELTQAIKDEARSHA